MASLKEIKSRIQSVKSTQKITSAMKMVSSAKLRKAQRRIQNFYPYQKRLTSILNDFLSAESEYSTVYATEREVEKVGIVVLSSNSSLCGSFNSNIAKQLNKTLSEYQHLPKENITIYPIGKKVAQAVKKLLFSVPNSYEDLIDEPIYKEAQELANELMQKFANRELDKVVLIYHHFVSKSKQVIEANQFLPISLDIEGNSSASDYIVEPSRQEIMDELIPKVIRLQLYTALLDSSASEHAARMIAMQMATDNADDLIGELNLQYNKSRQQAITSELLDIIGGSFGQQ